MHFLLLILISRSWLPTSECEVMSYDGFEAFTYQQIVFKFSWIWYYFPAECAQRSLAKDTKCLKYNYQNKSRYNAYQLICPLLLLAQLVVSVNVCQPPSGDRATSMGGGISSMLSKCTVMWNKKLSTRYSCTAIWCRNLMPHFVLYQY